MCTCSYRNVHTIAHCNRANKKVARAPSVKSGQLCGAQILELASLHDATRSSEMRRPDLLRLMP